MKETAFRGLIAGIDGYLSRFDGGEVRGVREGIARWQDGPVHDVPAARVSACRHMEAALAAMGALPLAGQLSDLWRDLAWTTYDLYPPAEIGEAFAAGHAFASLIGSDAPLKADGFELGLFLIAPHVLYRDHHHAAAELYAPLTGPHGWRFRPGDALEWRDAHVPVCNPPWRPHATKVGHIPFLCIFGWTGDVNEPARVLPSDDRPALEALRLA